MRPGLFLIKTCKQPTHDRVNQTQNILDLVFTNEEDMISETEYGAKLGNSDCKMLKLILTVTVSQRRISHGSLSMMKEIMNS